jgi:hypothetical protein
MDPVSFAHPQETIRAHLMLPIEAAEKATESIFQQVDIALGAAHAQMPDLVRGATRRGEPIKDLPRPWQTVRPLIREADRVLEQEAELVEFMQRRGEVSPSRFPDIESLNAPGNFRNRVVRPFRGVGHLAAGIAQTLESVETELGALFKDSGPSTGQICLAHTRMSRGCWRTTYCSVRSWRSLRSTRRRPWRQVCHTSPRSALLQMR